MLRAECRAHLDNADAVKDLNRIRERAGLMGYVVLP
ncbi:MAG: RagB/SusD family nutrient uptake outer membrane protein [Butyricimonas faecihominis]